MPEDKTRVSYDENGGKVTQIPEGTPKEEMEKARKEGRMDKNDPNYNEEDAKKDAAVDEKIVEAEVDGRNKAVENAKADAGSRNTKVEHTEQVRVSDKKNIDK